MPTSGALGAVYSAIGQSSIISFRDARTPSRNRDQRAACPIIELSHVFHQTSRSLRASVISACCEAPARALLVSWPLAVCPVKFGFRADDRKDAAYLPGHLVRIAFLPICVSTLIKHLRQEIEIAAPNYMPEVVSYLPYDFKKMLESCPQAAS
jgi:hypothetical protein